MPICFQLYRKGSTKPEMLSVVDAEICYHFRVELDPVRYHAWWYDIIGFKLALGKTWDQIRTSIRDSDTLGADWVWDADTNHLLDIVNWLEANYSPTAFYQSKSQAREYDERQAAR